MSEEQIKAKTLEFINKNKDLLEEKKYYEFAQKVKLMGNRKGQGKKLREALQMYSQGADTLYSIAEVEQNVPLQLISQIVATLQAEPQLLTPDQEKSLLAILQKRPMNSRKIGIIWDIMQKTGKPTSHAVLADYYVDYHVGKGRFATVETLVSKMPRDKIVSFLRKWTACPELLEHEKPAVWCRLVLERAIVAGIDEGQQLFKQCIEAYSGENPYTFFTGFVLKTLKLRSNEAFSAIEKGYQPFLSTDPIFSMLLGKIGIKYFGREKQNGGIMSLLE